MNIVSIYFYNSTYLQFDCICSVKWSFYQMMKFLFNSMSNFPYYYSTHT